MTIGASTKSQVGKPCLRAGISGWTEWSHPNDLSYLRET